jgi:hypothetical protein
MSAVFKKKKTIFELQNCLFLIMKLCVDHRLRTDAVYRVSGRGVRIHLLAVAKPIC